MAVNDVEEAMKNAREAIYEHWNPEAITERFEIALDSAEQKMRAALKEARRSAEDLRDGTRHTIKRYPFESVMIGIAIGVVTGVLTGWLIARKKRPSAL